MRRTIASLGLDVPAALAGKTWLLLPEGFRDQSCGLTYPLPTSRDDLQKLVVVPIPRRSRDAGCLYLRRAMKEFAGRQARRNSASRDIACREHEVKLAQRRFSRTVKEACVQAKAAVDQVRQDAEKAVASLGTLFALGREGIEGQMKAHLAGVEWQGQNISARDFRDCFRMVLQGVKGLGLPSEQRASATEAVMQELADSLKDTQEAVALAPGRADEVAH